MKTHPCNQAWRLAWVRALPALSALLWSFQPMVLAADPESTDWIPMESAAPDVSSVQYGIDASYLYAQVELAELLHFGGPLDADTLLVVVSQSGETVEAVRERLKSTVTHLGARNG